VYVTVEVRATEFLTKAEELDDAREMVGVRW
jgi:hypothetical protein